MHSHRHNIFLNGDGVIIISLTVHKLLNADQLIINNFFLGLELGFKRDIFIVAIA